MTDAVPITPAASVKLLERDIEVLKMLDGTGEPQWGAWVSECLGFLAGAGYCTPGPQYEITEAGRRALESGED